MTALARIDAISVETLDRMTAILGAQMRLKLIPDSDWGHNRLTRVVTYPRQELLQMDAQEATGKLWRCVQHALSSWGELSAYDVAVDAMIEAEAQAGVRAVHARWILGVMHEVERERIERIARKHARNLINSALPLRGTGYRSPEGEAIRDALAQENTDGPAYWERVALACGGLCAGTIGESDLPADMPWDGLIDDIKALADAPSYDDLLVQIERIIPQMSKRWITHLTEPQEPEAAPPPPPSSGMPAGGTGSLGSSPEGSAGEDATSSSGGPASGGTIDDDGDEDGEISAASPKPAAGEDDTASSDPAPGSSLDESVRERLEASVESESDDRAGIDYFNNAVKSEDEIKATADASPGWGSAANPIDDQHLPGPAWGAVSRTNARVQAPIARAFQKFLAENDIGEMERGLRSGRLNPRVAMLPPLMQSQPPFQRRRILEERSYDIGFIIDHSGSMCAGASGEAHEEAFGTGNLSRWHLSARMAVALAESVTNMNGITTTIVAYDSYVKVVKKHNDGLTPAVKQRVMDTIRPQGDNEDAGAINVMADELKKAPGRSKFIIHLTDGQFCSSTASMKSAVARLNNEHIGYVVLTLGISPEFARRYVPEHCAEQIDDENVGRVLAKHLNRMLRTQAA